MSLKEFIESYEGFNWENGEIVVVHQRVGKQYICKYHKFANPDVGFKLARIPGLYIDNKLMEMDVYSWTHTEKTMLIVL